MAPYIITVKRPVTVEEFYERTGWPLGTRVQHPDRDDVRGTIVKRGGRIWVSRDKLPWVRWDGKIDAEQIAWEALRRPHESGTWPIRRAVATLQTEPLAEVLRPILRGGPPRLTAVQWVEMMERILALPESGGTVGPLPDGTVIEVAPITWQAIYDAVPGTYESARDLIDAYNAKKEEEKG